MNPMNPLDSKKIQVASGFGAKMVAQEKSVFKFFVSFTEKNPRLISFWIICFFGKKESVWSHAIIHFWILPMKYTLSDLFVQIFQYQYLMYI